MPEDLLAPVGGPRGYLYNLKQEIDRRGLRNIYFLPPSEKSKIVLPSFLSGIWNSLSYTFSLYKGLYGNNHSAQIDLNEFDIIHFHDTWRMFISQDSLKTYKGKVVLTSHSPTILSKEWHDEASKMKKHLCGKMLKDLIRMDEYAFNRAHYILFPCKEAEEPYEHAWSHFKDLKASKKERFLYNPSGIVGKTVKESREFICEKYGIPSDAVIFSYAGRHNSIKGYDDLKNMAEIILAKNPKAYFLIAGKENPLSGLNHPRWIEVGWTNDPHSLIGASDAFVLPNKETYFDLILLEVLSLGKMVVASESGGNKYFKKWDGKGIYLYNKQSEAVQLLEKIAKMTTDEKHQAEAASLSIFSSNFTIELFVDRYLDIISRL